MLARESDFGETLQRPRFARCIPDRVPHQVVPVGQCELAGGVGLAGDERDVRVLRFQRGGERRRAAADDEPELRLARLEREEVEQEVGLDAGVLFEQGQFGLQEPRDAGAGDDHGPLVDGVEGRGQDALEGPEMAGVVDPAGLAGHDVHRERVAVLERKLGVHHEDQFAVLAVEVHAEHGRHLGGVHDRRLVAAVHVQRLADVEAEQVEEVRQGEVEASLRRPFRDVLPHEQDRLVLGVHEVGDVGRQAVDPLRAAAAFQRAGQRHGSLPHAVRPVPSEKQLERGGHGAGHIAGDALEVLRRVPAGQPLGAAQFLLRLPFPFGIGAAPDEREAEGDDVRADDAALRAVAAGAMVFGVPVRQEFELRGHAAAAVLELAAHERVLVLGPEHAAAVEERLPDLEHLRPGPVHQHLLCERNPHDTKSGQHSADRRREASVD